MARVIKPDGLVVIVDSIQKGDLPEWDGLLDLFPHYFHEPYYADYANGRIEQWAGAADLTLAHSERAFLSRVAAFARSSTFRSAGTAERNVPAATTNPGMRVSDQAAPRSGAPLMEPQAVPSNRKSL